MKFSNAKLRFWLGLAAAAIALGLSAAAQATQTDIASSPRVEQGPRDPGSKIAFTRVEIAVPGFEDSNEAEIWTMNGDGSEPRRLTNNATFDLGAVWSPNGKTVAFYGYDVEAPDPHVFLINADGGEQTQLTEMRGRFPSWSASGKIAFDNAAGDIFAVNPDGSGLERLTNDPAARNIRPDWSPNGQKIAFTTRRDGNDEIYSMNAERHGADPTDLRPGRGQRPSLVSRWRKDRLPKKRRRRQHRDLLNESGRHRPDPAYGLSRSRPGCGLVAERPDDRVRARHRAHLRRDPPAIHHERGRLGSHPVHRASEREQPPRLGSRASGGALGRRTAVGCLASGHGRRNPTMERSNSKTSLWLALAARTKGRNR
jgi:dipeptidyl aminopeptidase/acylaminoacyl peptidase